MFCENCGALINDNAKFCSNCGAAIGESTEEIAVSNTLAKDSLIEELDYAENCIDKAEEKLVSILPMKNDIEELKCFVSTYQGKRRIPSHEKEKAISILCKYSNENKNIAKKYEFITLIIFILEIILIFILSSKEAFMSFLLMPIPIVTVLVMSKIFTVANYISSKLSGLNQNYNALYNEAYDYYNSEMQKYIESNDVIPTKYLSKYAINYIREALINKRADSLKEALNLFENFDAQQQLIRENNKNYQILMEQMHYQQELINLNHKHTIASQGVTNALLIADLFSNIG